MKIHQQPRAAYLIGSAVVWAGLIAATAVLFVGTPHFGEMLPILFVGAIWSLLLAPVGLVSRDERPDKPGPRQGSEGVRHDAC
jgi:hypothetical protein